MQPIPLATGVLPELIDLDKNANDQVWLSYALVLVARADSLTPEQAFNISADLLARGADASFNLDPSLDLAYLQLGGSNQALAIQAEDYNFPLHAAAANGNSLLVEILVQNGADVSRVDQDGKRPDDLAEGLGFDALADSLRRLVLQSAEKRPKSALSSQHSELLGGGDDSCTPMDIDFRGWVFKKHRHSSPVHNKQWSRRWLVLQGVHSKLKVFKSCDDQGDGKELVSEISVQDMLSVGEVNFGDVDPNEYPGEFIFELNTWSHIYVFVTDDDASRQDWIMNLDRLIQFKDSLSSPWMKGKSPLARTRRHIDSASPSFTNEEHGVFGVSLEKLAQRRQGPRDKGVPLFISKTLGFFDQLWTPNFPLHVLYQGDIRGIHRSYIHLMVKELKQKFDVNDESVDLQAEFARWRTEWMPSSSPIPRHHPAPVVSIGLGFARALILLVLHYLGTIPEPVIPMNVLEPLCTSVGRLKVDLADLKSSPAALQELLVPELERLSFPHWQTLRKVILHLKKLFGSHPEAVRNELIKVWTNVLCSLRHEQGQPPSNRCQDLIMLLIDNVDVLLQLRSPPSQATCGSLLLAASRDTQDDWSPPGSPALRSFDSFTIDIQMCLGESEPELPVQTQTIRASTTVKQFLECLRKILNEDGTLHNLDNFSLFLPAENGWLRPFDSSSDDRVYNLCKHLIAVQTVRLVYQYSPYTALKRNLPVIEDSSVFRTGWLYKEGVSVKSWKYRYFELRMDGLYYYKNDSEIDAEDLLGKIDFRAYSLLVQDDADSDFLQGPFENRKRKAPTRHRLCFGNATRSDIPSRFLCALSPDELHEWVAWIMLLSENRPKEELKKEVRPAPIKTTALSDPRDFENQAHLSSYKRVHSGKVARRVTITSPDCITHHSHRTELLFNPSSFEELAPPPPLAAFLPIVNMSDAPLPPTPIVRPSYFQ